MVEFSESIHKSQSSRYGHNSSQSGSELVEVTRVLCKHDAPSDLRRGEPFPNSLFFFKASVYAQVGVFPNDTMLIASDNMLVS